MVPPLPSTQVETYNTAANIIMYKTAKQKITIAIDMRFYWVRNIIEQNHFHIFWEEEKKNLVDFVTKKTPNMAPKNHETTIFETDNIRHRKLKRPAECNRKRM